MSDPTDVKPAAEPQAMANPSETCEHHFVSVHQPHFPPAAYWVRLCSFCDRIEIDPGNPDARADAELVALVLAEARLRRAWWVADSGVSFADHHEALEALESAVEKRLEGETR